MIQYALAIIFLIGVSIWHYCIALPKKKIKIYANNFRDKGYKVYEVPFSAFDVPLVRIRKRDTLEGDAFRIVKTVFSDFDVIISNSLSRVFIIFTHPNLIKDFSSKQHIYTYPKLKKFVGSISRAMGEGVVFSEGEVWKRKRRIISSVFNFDLVKSMCSKIEAICQKSIAEMEMENKGKEPGVFTYNVLKLTNKMFSQVMLECFLGSSVDEKIEQKPAGLYLEQLIGDLTRRGLDLPVIIFGNQFPSYGLRAKDRRINRKLAIYNKWGLNFVKNRISEVTANIEGQKDRVPTDIIEALVAERKKQEKSNEDIYSDEQIFEEFNVFFVAGTDTTSHFLGMMIYLVVLNPGVERKLRDEIDKYMNNDDYQFENLKNFVYIDKIQKQTLRIYGPGGAIFMRLSNQDTYIDGVQVPKNTILSISHLANHYSTRYFQRPEEFRPERWDNECDDLSPFAHGSFGVGARTCIGKHLAMIESKIGLIKFMKRYKQIELPFKELKQIRMLQKLVYTPEDFDTRLLVNSP